MTTINVTINGGFKSNVVDEGTLGTMDGGTSSKDFTITGVSTNQLVDISDVIVSPNTDPSFDTDYAFNYEWSREWDDSDSEVDITVTVNWDTDPGSGNDLDLAYKVRN